MNTTDLIGQLQSADAQQQLEAAETLGTMGEAASDAALPLVERLGSEDERVREAATAALEGLGAPPAGMTGELAKRLTAENAACAFWAATLLGRIGSDAASATDALANVVADETAPAEVRQKSAWALGKIGPPARAALPVLLSANQNDDARLARQIESAIAAIES